MLSSIFSSCFYFREGTTDQHEISLSVHLYMVNKKEKKKKTSADENRGSHADTDQSTAMFLLSVSSKYRKSTDDAKLSGCQFCVWWERVCVGLGVAALFYNKHSLINKFGSATNGTSMGTLPIGHAWIWLSWTNLFHLQISLARLRIASSQGTLQASPASISNLCNLQNYVTYVIINNYPIIFWIAIIVMPN